MRDNYQVKEWKSAVDDFYTRNGQLIMQSVQNMDFDKLEGETPDIESIDYRVRI